MDTSNKGAPLYSSGLSMFLPNAANPNYLRILSDCQAIQKNTWLRARFSNAIKAQMLVFCFYRKRTA
jgi:hypothetical protein